jgi:cell division protein FtsQ
MTVLLLKINEDPFMKNSVVGLSVLADEKIILRLRKQDFKVHLGKIEKIEKKFQNYKAFYHKSKQDNTLKDYKLVNLEYLSQVVATKL